MKHFENSTARHTYFRTDTRCSVCGQLLADADPTDVLHITTPRQPRGRYIHTACVWCNGKRGAVKDADATAEGGRELKGRESQDTALYLDIRVDSIADPAAVEVLAADYGATPVKAPGKGIAIRFPVRGTLHGLKDLFKAVETVGPVKDVTARLEYSPKRPELPTVATAFRAMDGQEDGFGKGWRYFTAGTAWTVKADAENLTVRRMAYTDAQRAAWNVMLLDAVAKQATTKNPEKNAAKHVARHMDGTAQYQKAERNK